MYREILFFFSAIGVFNSFILGIYLLLFQSEKRSRYLPLAMLMLSIRVGVSCFYFFNQDIDPSLIQLGLCAHLLSAVFLLEYIVEIHGAKSSSNRRYYLIVLILFILIAGLIFPFSEHWEVWDHQIRFTIHFIVTIYLIISIFQMRGTITKCWKRQRLHSSEIEALIVLCYFLLTYGAFAVSLFTSYILGPLLFSIIFYIAFMTHFFVNKSAKRSTEKYVGKKIKKSEALMIIDRLTRYLQENKMYKNTNLKISDLAKELHISSHKLSQIINENLDKNFSNYINEFRIEEAKELLLKENQLTVESIAFEVGFNSKSSFYSLFKEYTGQTPANYKRLHKS